MRKRLRVSLCFYLWRPEEGDEALKAGAIPSLSVGLYTYTIQGPGNSAFRSISLSEPMQRWRHDRSMSMNYLIRWTVHRLGMRRIQESFPPYTDGCTPPPATALSILVGQRHATNHPPSSFSVPSHGWQKGEHGLGKHRTFALTDRLRLVNGANHLIAPPADPFTTYNNQDSSLHTQPPPHLSCLLLDKPCLFSNNTLVKAWGPPLQFDE